MVPYEAAEEDAVGVLGINSGSGFMERRGVHGPSRSGAYLAGGRGLIFALACSVSTAALAAEPAPPGQTDVPDYQGDIIVTANRTEQKLQRVGVAATVLSADNLAASGISSTDALVTATPGLQIAQPGGPGLTSLISIRGVSQNDFAGHLESPNSFYVDDAYQVAPSANTQPLFDVKRVEVLKGPQGTLFGRNSVGGLINIITNDPVDDFEGTTTGEIGSLNHVKVEGALNAPLGGGSAIRIAFYKSNQDGYLRNVFNDTRQNGDNSIGLRGKLKLQISSDLTAQFSADYFKFTSDAANVAFMVGGVTNADGLGVSVPGQATAYGYIDADGDPYTVAADFNGGLHRENGSVGAKLTYDLGGATLVSQTNFGWAKSYYAEDNDSSPLDYTRFFQTSKSNSLTQELRLFGSSDRANWTVGAFYVHIDGGPYTQRFELRNSGPNLIGPINAALDTLYSLKTNSWSVFGQYAYDLTNTLNITGGLRYTRDRKDFNFRFLCDEFASGLGCAIGLIPPPGTEGSASPYADKHSEGAISGRVAIEYKPTSNLLLYASYSRGYKAFSYNVSFSGLAPLNGVRFNGEKINAYEVGQKYTFMGGRGRFNLSGFYYDYEDYQAFDQRGLNLTLYNTSAKIKGLEAELGLNTGGWALNVAGTLLDAKVDNVKLPNGPASRRPPQTPKFTLLGSISKRVPISSGDLNLDVSAIYTGEAFAQLTNAPNTRLPANVIGNARIAYKPSSGAYEIAIYARNIFDNRSVRYAFDLTSPLLGASEGNYGPPRTYGASVKVNF
ncbi:TonB-dependent receptor [Novosphingobium taihuense]|uniref:Iron complex outermembrane receptor protein n=1 Tax=Novosphingobium taihuense TaxID=260085 RepID=A0A7W7AEW9_9SPHN|nr:TonB-dependent receptor [Novosphingobium taihuense]MBB4615790.1 iron complex outermembrane receptor protein [Novosphingobium taihuense]TWH79220.1 iron complex outermembrane receptor protein [Novosphingobium taihuense]